MKVQISILRSGMAEKLISCGVPSDDANSAADIFYRATLRDVGHHDIHDFLGRVKQLKGGYINPTPDLQCLMNFGALEQWDGDNGLGEVCCHHITKRSMALAKELGIGFATIRNSNHFLAAAPYTEIADEEGFLTLVMSKSPGGISLPGADQNIIGNNPFGYAAGHSETPLALDICCAYSSYGKMNALAKEGGTVPEYWGNDSQGQATTNPKDIQESGLYMPIGNHKGFGMALMIELFTAILSGGNILNQEEADTGLKGVYTQTAISIDVSKFMAMVDYEHRVNEMVQILKGLYPEIYIPGQGSNESKSRILKQGWIDLPQDLVRHLGISESIEA